MLATYRIGHYIYAQFVGKRGGGKLHDQAKKIKLDNSATKQPNDEIVDDIVTKILKNEFTQAQLAQALRQSQNQSMYSETLNLGSHHKNILTTCTTKTFLDQCNPILLAFMDALCHIQSHTDYHHDSHQEANTCIHHRIQPAVGDMTMSG